MVEEWRGWAMMDKSKSFEVKKAYNAVCAFGDDSKFDLTALQQCIIN